MSVALNNSLCSEFRTQSTDVHVSVIFVTWNARSVLIDALKSLYSYDHDCSLEVIVVDNGSSDGTVLMLRDDWPAVQVVPLSWNAGFAAANNIGIARARGRYVLLLNSDTICLPTTISGLVQQLEQDPSIGCVGARHLNNDCCLERSTNAFPTLLNDALEIFELSRFECVQRFLAPRFPWFTDHSRTIDTGWVNGACMMLRKAVIEEVGAFDEAFFIYVEEVELCYRIQQAGWRVVFTPHSEVIHLEGHAYNSNPCFRLRLRFWGHVYFYKKHYSKLRYGVFVLLVSMNAVCRAMMLFVLGILKYVGYRPSPQMWEIVMADRGRAATHRACILAWLKIMFHLSPEVP